jgi:hypothetical protein
MEAGPDDRLEVFVVWLPMLPSDSLQSATESARIFEGTHARQFWDGEQALARLVGESVAIAPATLAWDIYLIYDRDAVIGDRAPVPLDWVHQLSRVAPERYRGGRIAQAVSALVDQVLSETENR